MFCAKSKLSFDYILLFIKELDEQEARICHTHQFADKSSILICHSSMVMSAGMEEGTIMYVKDI